MVSKLFLCLGVVILSFSMLHEGLRCSGLFFHGKPEAPVQSSPHWSISLSGVVHETHTKTLRAGRTAVPVILNGTFFLFFFLTNFIFLYALFYTTQGPFYLNRSSNISQFIPESRLHWLQANPSCWREILEGVGPL